MKKIAIATITITVDNENAYNYGNRLQAYALQKFITNQGDYCETIKYKAKMPDIKAEISSKRHDSFIQKVDDGLRIIRRKIRKNELLEKNNSRKDAFKLFLDKNVKYTDKTYESTDDFSELADMYDCFVVGSDQVWNPYCEGSNEFYYLTFAQKEKRIAYAPSIAVNDIPEELENNYNEWLNGFNRISVREEAGRKLIKEKFNLDAEVVCDPVFLLDRQQWESIAKDVPVKEKYFATYFLGKQDILTKKYIRELEKKTGLRHIDIYTRDNPDSVFAGPEQFLGLIKNAEFLCTDSFHGTAFSIIFKTPMLIFDRKSTFKVNSRIESILNISSIGNRNIDLFIKDKKDIYDIKFDEDGALEILIEKSKKYLIDEINKR